MINQTKDVKQELFDKQIEYGFLKIVDCSDQDNAQYERMKNNGEGLPENVRQYKDTQTNEYVNKFYYLKDSRLSDAEKQEYLKYIELDLPARWVTDSPTPSSLSPRSSHNSGCDHSRALFCR